MNKPTLQRSATEINKITGFIMGVRKFGKTSLWEIGRASCRERV